MKTSTLLDWVLRLVPALILLQTLFFKFTAAPESVYIFSTLGVEPWGRIGSGVVELIAGFCLLYRPLVWLGSGLAIGLMSGAVFSHLTLLGIEVMEDGGQLFYMAVVTLIFSSILAWKYRGTIPLIGHTFTS